MRDIEKFIVEDLSQWYIRRSRRRFQKPESKGEKEEAAKTLYFVLLESLKLMAPAIPFVSENIYQEIKAKGMPESIHLCDWPEAIKKDIDKKLEEKMIKVRYIVTKTLAERKAKGIKVRQPLRELEIGEDLDKGLKDIIKEEVNLKRISYKVSLKNKIKLDCKLDEELKKEGMIREVIRQVQVMRKKAGYKPEDKISIFYSGDDTVNSVLKKKKEYVLKESKAEKFEMKNKEEISYDLDRSLNINNQEIWLAIKKL